MNSTRNKIAVGAGWMVSLRWVDRLINLVSIAILARILLPADFGLVAYAMVFLGILDQFFLFSFETVLIRDKEYSHSRYSTVWTLEIIKGLFIGAILVIGAESVAVFFSEPQVKGILYWIAIVPALKGFANVGIVDFQKDLTFDKEFYFNLLVRLSGSVTAIVLALILRSYWSLVYAAIVRIMFRVVLSYAMCKFRPRLSLSEYSAVLGFSFWLLVQNIFSGINQRLPAIAIGRFFEAQSLAFFNMAHELTSMMTNLFAAPVRRALYPGIAKMQDDTAEMAKTLTSALGVILLVGLPATIGIGMTAPLLVPAILGDQWITVAPLVTILSLYAAIQMFYPNSNVIFYAQNRPRITAYIAGLRLLLMVPAILIIVPEHGAIGAAWSLVAINGLIMVVDYVVLIWLTEVSIVMILASIWRSLIAVAIMAYCVWKIVTSIALPDLLNSTLLHLGLSVIAGAVIYCGMLWLIWTGAGRPEGPEAYVWKSAKSVIGRSVRAT